MVLRKWPGTQEMDYKLLDELEDELVPKADRGKFQIATFLDIICLPENDCAGTRADWDNVTIYRNSGTAGAHYDLIQWRRHECGQQIGMHPH